MVNRISAVIGLGLMLAAPLAAQTDLGTVPISTLPSIGSFSPGSGILGTSVTISGKNLGGTTAVRFGSATAPIVSRTTTTLVATVPALTAGGYTITVVTPDGNVARGTFTVTASAPGTLPTPSESVKQLQAAGATVDSITRVLQVVYHQTVEESAQQLRLTGGYTHLVIARSQQKIYAANSAKEAAALKYAGFAAAAIGQAGKEVFLASDLQTASDLRNVGFGVIDGATVQKDVYAVTAQKAAQNLKSVGYAAKDITTAEKSVFLQSAQQTAAILKAAGYGITDIYYAVSPVFTLAKSEVISILQAVGFALQDIIAAIGS